MTTLSRFRLPARGARIAAATLFTAVVGTVALSAWAQPHGMGHGGPGMGPDGPGMMMMGGGRGLERMLDSVNATADQRTQIKAIADAAMKDLKTLHDSGKTNRQDMAKLFAQPTVDANAVEALRVKQMQQHDAASRRMTQAMIDASRVLTPDQRKQLADRMEQRRAMMERHMSERRALDGAAPGR